jgi:hypothetical protein
MESFTASTAIAGGVPDFRSCSTMGIIPFKKSFCFAFLIGLEEGGVEDDERSSPASGKEFFRFEPREADDVGNFSVCMRGSGSSDLSPTLAVCSIFSARVSTSSAIVLASTTSVYPSIFSSLTSAMLSSTTTDLYF